MALSKEKLTLCWPNYIEDATLTGGSWTTERPLTNAKERVFAKKARSVDLSPSSTEFSSTLGGIKPVQVVSIVGHNFSVLSGIRIRVYSDLAQTTVLHDSGIIDVWRALYQTEELEWEYDNFWAGNITSVGEFTPLFTYFIPEPQVAQSVKVEIFDGDNADGYIEFGRVFIGDAWQPNVNIDYGVSFGYQNTTTVTETYDTTEYFDVKRQKRTMEFSFGRLSEEEAFSKLYAMQRTQGMSKEILVAYNHEDNPQRDARTFLGRQQQLDPISHPFIENYTTTMSLLEIL